MNLNIRIEPALMKETKARATARGQPLSWYVREALKAANLVPPEKKIVRRVDTSTRRG